MKPTSFIDGKYSFEFLTFFFSDTLFQWNSNIYDENRSRRILDFLLNAAIDGMILFYLPFFVYKLSFIYTPLIILFSVLFLRPITSFEF